MNLRLCVAVLLLLPPAAFAQGNPGPFGGLFGRTPERTGRDFTLFELRTSGGWQLDDAVFDGTHPADTRLTSGTLAGANGHVMYERQTDRIRLRARSAATFHQFLQMSPAVGGTMFETNGMFSGRVGTRLSIDASASHFYTPFFYYEPVHLPYQSGVMTVTSPYVAKAIESDGAEGSVGFSSKYAKHSTLSGSVTWRETRFRQRPDYNFTLNGARGLWTRQLNRDFALRLGYGREHVRTHAEAMDDTLYETIEAGIDFTRGLSLTRRTTLGIRTETAMVKRPVYGRHVRLNGGLKLTHWLRKTWQITVQADRRSEFVPGFVEPLLSDTAGVTLTGLLSRHAEVIVRADGGRGQFGFDLTAIGQETNMATSIVQLNYALTRKLGVFGQHALFFYELPAGASSVAPVARLGRQTLSIGITAWIPLLIRERAPSDTR